MVSFTDLCRVSKSITVIPLRTSSRRCQYSRSLQLTSALVVSQRRSHSLRFPSARLVRSSRSSSQNISSGRIRSKMRINSYHMEQHCTRLQPAVPALVRNIRNFLPSLRSQNRAQSCAHRILITWHSSSAL